MSAEKCKPTEHHFFNLGSLDMKTYVIACEKCGETREFQADTANTPTPKETANCT